VQLVSTLVPSLALSLGVMYILSSALVCSQPKDIKLKMGGHKLRSDVNWQGSLKQKGVKQIGIKQSLPILCIISLCLASKYPEDVDSRCLQIITGVPDKTALHPTKLLTYSQHCDKPQICEIYLCVLFNSLIFIIMNYCLLLFVSYTI